MPVFNYSSPLTARGNHATSNKHMVTNTVFCHWPHSPPDGIFGWNRTDLATIPSSTDLLPLVSHLNDEKCPRPADDGNKAISTKALSWVVCSFSFASRVHPTGRSVQESPTLSPILESRDSSPFSCCIEHSYQSCLTHCPIPLSRAG